MVTGLVSRSSRLESNRGRGHCVVFLCKTLYSHSASLHPGTHKRVLVNFTLGVTCDGLASNPGGKRNTPSRFMLQIY